MHRGSHLKLAKGKNTEDEDSRFPDTTACNTVEMFEKIGQFLSHLKSSQTAIFTTLSGYGKIPQKALLL